MDADPPPTLSRGPTGGGSGGTWVEGDLDGDRIADFSIRFDGTTTFAAADFIL